jgi:hypothetical protein
MRKQAGDQRSPFVVAAGLLLFGLCVYLWPSGTLTFVWGSIEGVECVPSDCGGPEPPLRVAAGMQTYEYVSVHEFVFEEQPCEERPCPVACHAGTLVELNDGSVLTAW